MDGLLVDSERLERRAWQGAAEDCGVVLTDERFATFVGNPAEVCDRMLGAYYGAALDVAEFRASAHRRMRDLVSAGGVPLRPGASEWLRFVAGLGIPLGLATSSAPDLVRERLDGQLAMFATVVTRADVSRGKPHPDIYLLAAHRLGVAPHTVLALEDSPIGARAAIAAGMAVAVVPDLVPTPADVAGRVVGIFDSLHEVRAAARAWGVPSAQSGA